LRYSYLIAPLVLFPLCAYSQNFEGVKTRIFSQKPMSKNTLMRSHSNEADLVKKSKHFDRSIDFPTQIIRISGDVASLNMSCDEVFSAIDEKLLSPIENNLFGYNHYTFCQYNEENEDQAIRFEINSYFDPINDKAIEYYQNYFKETNGADLLGTEIAIESARGLVITLNVTARFKKEPDNPPYKVYRQDQNTLYFNNNYDMETKLVTDIYDNFFSNQPEQVLPFYDRWLFSFASTMYRPVLKEANYVELFPERIFLMDKGEPIFVSSMKHSYAHDCAQYENHRCLA